MSLPLHKIVVPVDFSDESFAAVDTALELIGDATKVHVVHVLPEIHPADPGVIWQAIDVESRRHHATEALRERLTEAAHDGLNLHVEFGDPGYRVTHYADEIGANLIVMPSHGRRGFKRMMIGSVAERVIRLAQCPVLVMRK